MDPIEETHLTLTDFTGKEHHFRVTLRESAGGIAAEAVEEGSSTGGYRFRVAVPPGALGAAYHELHKKMAALLNTRHLERDPDTKAWRPTHGILRGRIESDTQNGEPRLIVDGRALSWHELARVFLMHEGWDFEVRFEG